MYLLRNALILLCLALTIAGCASKISSLGTENNDHSLTILSTCGGGLSEGLTGKLRAELQKRSASADAEALLSIRMAMSDSDKLQYDAFTKCALEVDKRIRDGKLKDEKTARTFAAHASASNWSSYNSSVFGILLADRASVVQSGDTVKFWAAQALIRLKPGQPAYTKDVYVVDCKQLTFRLMQSTAFDASEQPTDIPVSSLVREIEPDSKENALAQFACGSDTGRWTPVTHVAEFFHDRAEGAKQGLLY